MPISKFLSVCSASGLKWNERVIPLELLWQPKIGMADTSDGFAALLESLAEISRSGDKVGAFRVPDEFLGDRRRV